MELTKPGLLILVIIGSVAICHCGPTSTCRLVGVRVNGQTINKTPRHKDVLCYAEQKDGNGGIKFSYWPYWTGPKKLKDLNKLNMVIVAKSKEVNLKDMPSIITVEGIYGESEGRLHKFKKLFVRGSGTDRDTSDIKHKKRSKSRSSSGRGSSVRRGSRSGSQERLINPKSADNINRGSSSRIGSQSYNIEPDNCENEKKTYFKFGVWPKLQYSPVYIIYRSIIKKSKYSCSIGYYRENQEWKTYPLPPIATVVETYILLTLDEDGKIIQDGDALSADITNSLLEVKDTTKKPYDYAYDVPDLFLRRKNQDQKFPKELFFESTDKSTGDINKIKYKYIDVAGEHDPVHKLDLPGNQQRARYIGTCLNLKYGGWDFIGTRLHLVYTDIV